MSMITPWLVVAALVVMLFGVVYVALKDRKADKKEIKRLTEELESQKKISKELCSYVEEISKINGDKNKVAEKIKEAETDEEVLSIIAGLVHTNNDKLHK